MNQPIAYQHVTLPDPKIQKNVNTVLCYAWIVLVTALCYAIYCIVEAHGDKRFILPFVGALVVPFLLWLCGYVGATQKQKCCLCCSATSWFLYAIVATVWVILGILAISMANELGNDWKCFVPDSYSCTCTLDTTTPSGGSRNREANFPMGSDGTCSVKAIRETYIIGGGVILAFNLCICFCACDAFRAACSLCRDPYFNEQFAGPTQPIVAVPVQVQGQAVPMVPAGASV